MGVLLWLFEAFLILFVSTGIALISASVCVCTTILGCVILWTYLDKNELTPPYWTPLGVLQGIATLLVLLPHIRRGRL